MNYENGRKIAQEWMNGSRTWCLRPQRGERFTLFPVEHELMMDDDQPISIEQVKTLLGAEQLNNREAALWLVEEMDRQQQAAEEQIHLGTISDIKVQLEHPINITNSMK